MIKNNFNPTAQKLALFGQDYMKNYIVENTLNKDQDITTNNNVDENNQHIKNNQIAIKPNIYNLDQTTATPNLNTTSSSDKDVVVTIDQNVLDEIKRKTSDYNSVGIINNFSVSLLNDPLSDYYLSSNNSYYTSFTNYINKDSSAIWKLIQYSVDSYDQGLRLFPASTGSGKTFNIEKYISHLLASENYDNLKINRKIIFSTTNLQNINALYEHIKNSLEFNSENYTLLPYFDEKFDDFFSLMQKAFNEKYGYFHTKYKFFTSNPRIVAQRFENDVFILSNRFTLWHRVIHNIQGTDHENRLKTVINTINKRLGSKVDAINWDEICDLNNLIYDIENKDKQKINNDENTKDDKENTNNDINSKNDYNLNNKKYIDDLKDKFDKYARNLKSKIKYYLREEANKSKKSFKDYLYENDQEWVRILFPLITLQEKSVILLSYARFLYSIDDFISVQTTFYLLDYIKGKAIFVFDEFHQSHQVFLDYLIDKQLKHGINIYSFLEGFNNFISNERNINILLNKCSIESNDERVQNKVKKIKSSLYTIVDEYKKLFDEYLIDGNFVSDPKIRGNNLLYRSLHSIYSTHFRIHKNDKEKKEYFLVLKYPEDNHNLITLSDEYPDDKHNFFKFIQDATTLINKSMRLINNISRMYIEKQDRIPHSTKLNIEEVISSFLEEMSLDPKEVKDSIIEINNQQNSTNRDTNNSNENKIKYEIARDLHSDLVIMNDQNDHYFTTKLSRFMLNTSPEEILARICNNNLVIGLSATANAKTVIKNYSHSILSKLLKNNYLSLDDNDRKLLQDESDYINAGSDAINIILRCFDENYPKPDEDENYKSDSLIAREKKFWQETLNLEEPFINELFQTKLSNNTHFSRKRYFNIFVTFSNFILEMMNAFIYYGNKKPHKYTGENVDKDFDIDFIKNTCTEIFKKYKNNKKIDPDYDYKLLLADAKNIKDSLEELYQARLEGKKVLLIGTYSLSEGINFHYKINNIDSYDNIITLPNHFGGMQDIDLDGIYLEVPRNIIEDAPKNVYSQEGKATLLSIMAKLQGLLANYEIKPQLLQNIIVEIFSGQNQNEESEEGTGFNSYRSILLKTDSVKEAASLCVEQAIGRCTRTSHHFTKFFIFYDSELPERINPYSQSNGIETPFYQALVSGKKAKLEPKKCDNEIDKYHKRVERQCALAADELTKLLYKINNSHSKDTTKEWKELRDILLKNPTIGIQDYDNPNKNYGQKVIKHTYIDSICNKYYFKYDFIGYRYSIPENKEYNDSNGFKYCEIYLKSNKKDGLYFKKPIKGSIGVNDSALRLLMTNDDLRQYFKNNGYATEWTNWSNDKCQNYVMLPVVYNNIYKGILGETIGKWYFENRLKYKLDDLDAKVFEKFDFVIKEKYVFIDFKFYSINSLLFSNNDKVKKVLTKYKELCDEYKRDIKVIIINTTPCTESEHKKYIDYPYPDNPFIYAVPYIFEIKNKCVTVIQEQEDKIKSFIEGYGLQGYV